MAKYSFKARKYSLSSSGLRKTFGRSGNPARSSATGAAAHRTDVMVMVHSRTATSNSTVDSRAVIVKCMLQTSSHGGCQTDCDILVHRLHYSTLYTYFIISRFCNIN